MKKILITRKLIKSSEEYALKIFNAKLNDEDKILTKDQLISESEDCDGILSSITDKFDKDIIYKLSKKIKIIGFGPPVYQSITSIVCKIGILVPLAICVIQPIFPVAINSGFILSIFDILFSNNFFAISP